MTIKDVYMTAVSIKADREYIKALRAVAAVQGITVGELVRASLDAQLGDELKPYLDFFLSPLVLDKTNVAPKKSKRR